MTSSEPKPHSADTPHSLLEQVQRNVPEAWTKLVELYTGYVRQLLLRYHVAASDVDDLTQDVLLTIARKIGQFQPHDHRGAFRGWLKSIVRSKAMDQFRRQQARPQATGGTDAWKALAAVPDVDWDDDSDPREQQAQRDLYQKAMEIVRAECESRTWLMFHRALIEQVPTAEIAHEMGVSPAAVRVAKSRVLRKLRELLGEPLAES